MSAPEEKTDKAPLRGQTLFAIVFLVAALLLLWQLGEQTKWTKRTKLFAQPRFWPAIAIGGMVLFGGLHLWKLPHRRVGRADFEEWKIWFLAIEWVLWFLAYVALVPVLGYLPVTLVVLPVLVWRIGYRSRRMAGIAALFAVAVVVLFKALLDVKIPGAAVYDHLPEPLRGLFILNF
ncbi:tripartite tricarboxylate transporter TctB family protein [Shimia sp.]|uniref:tripartite tricarboxylate transporter TctB family protein n=1 Tax=Shimia sp. TaxID=1954381 RepID=UPI0035665E3D